MGKILNVTQITFSERYTEHISPPLEQVNVLFFFR